MTEEQKTRARDDAFKFLNTQVKAHNMIKKTYESLPQVHTISVPKSIHVYGLLTLMDVIDLPFVREDWEGNIDCESNWDIVYLMYKGYRFYDLVEKEDERE